MAAPKPGSIFENRFGARQERRPRIVARKAPPGGFEPPTVGLEVRCSIQLSYRGVKNQHTVRRLIGSHNRMKAVAVERSAGVDAPSEGLR